MEETELRITRLNRTILLALPILKGTAQHIYVTHMLHAVRRCRSNIKCLISYRQAGDGDFVVLLSRNVLVAPSRAA